MRNILKGTALLMAVVVLALMITGATQQSEALGTEDVRADVGQLSEVCTYFTGPKDARVEHYGYRNSITIIDPSAVSSAWGCTKYSNHYNQCPRPSAGCPPDDLRLRISDYLQGEHLFRFVAADPPSGCVLVNVEGLRKGVYYGHAGGTPIPPTYSDHHNGASEKICGLDPGEEVELLWMSCPDVTGHNGPDNKVDLFHDIFGTIFAYGLTKESPDWNPLTDHNEDGVVDLMNDIFFVIGRYSLNCDDFTQMG